MLVGQAAAGSDDARAELFRRHAERAWRSALLVTGSRDLADEAVQEGFLAAFGDLERFDASRPFAPWVGRIVVNRALNLARRDSRSASRTTDGAVVEWLDPDPLQRSAVRAALASLSTEQRAVVALRFWLDLSGPEIADALQLPLGTVRSRLSRALEALRTTVEEQQ